MSQLKLTDGGNIRTLGIILMAMAILCTSASAECSACDWIMEKINGIFPGDSNAGNSAATGANSNLEVKSVTPESSNASEISGDMLVTPSGVGKDDVILDVSESPTSFIPGAVHVSYLQFIDNNNTASLKTFPEIAKILGDAGIERSDSLVIYGECLPCGGGPSTATYAYWILRYVGHDKVKVLDGGIDAWTNSGMPVQNSSTTRSATTYSPVPRPELYATYDYVKSGAAQLVDARTPVEFEQGSIPGAMNIPYDGLLDDKLLKNRSGIDEVFRNLTSDRPVVVYTTTGVKASLSWFALTMTGREAKMYTWRDWIKSNRTG